MNSHRLAPLALALGIAFFGCDKKGSNEKKDDDKEEGSAKASSSAASKKPKREKNAASPVVQLAEKVVKECKWERGWFDSDCKVYDEWGDKREEQRDDGKADADLVSLLGDERPAMRYLGAASLSGSGEKYKTDPGLAEEIIAFAEKESDDFVLGELGEVIARIDFGKTKLLDRTKALMKDGASPKLRAPFFANVGFSNRDDQAIETALRDMTLAAATSSDNALRAAVMRGLMWFDVSDPICAAWAKGAADPKSDVVEAALDRGASKCPASFDAFLGAVDKAQKPLFSVTYPKVLSEVCAKGNPDQKKRAQAMAEDVAETSKSWMSRAEALRAVNACDKTAGKALAKKLSKDESADVKKEADKILKGS